MIMATCGSCARQRHLLLGSLRLDGRPSAGYWVPAAQVPDGLAVLPLDGVFEQGSQPPAGGDAGDVGGPAAGPDRDDEPRVAEGERLQLPALSSASRLRATV